MALKYPQIKAENILFRENFINSTYVTDNQGTLVAGATASNGLSLNGTSQYASFNTTDLNNGSDVTMVIRFTPDFNYDEDERRSFFGATDASLSYYAYKNNNAGSNALVCRYGGTTVASIIDSVYGAYWLTGEENVLIFASDGNLNGTNAWLNGTQILTNGGAAWTPPTDVESIHIGNIPTTAWYFDGVINGVDLLNINTTSQEASDIYNAVTFSDVDASKASLWLPCRSTFDDGSNIVTENIGSGVNTIVGNGAGLYEPTILSPHYFEYTGAATQFLDTGSDLIGTGDVTVGAMIKLDDWGEQIPRIMLNGKFFFTLYSVDNRVLLTSDGTTIKYSANDSIQSGNYYFIMVTRESDGTANIYINGELSGPADQNTGTPEAGAYNLLCGAGGVSANRFFDGTQGNYCIFNSILTPTQIRWQTEKAFKELNV